MATPDTPAARAVFSAAGRLPLRQGLAYGALGLPLAFVSLPLYVALPHYYASTYGVSLSALGLVLLLTRLLDAFSDPWLGQWTDKAFDLGTPVAWRRAAWAGVGLVVGMVALWRPPLAVSGSGNGSDLLIWLAGALMLTYVCYSILGITHQAWGARWGGTAPQRAQVVAWREGAALAGVMVGSALLGEGVVNLSHAVMALCMLGGLALLWTTRHWLGVAPGVATVRKSVATTLDAAAIPISLQASGQRPWQSPAFRGLFAVFVFNGIASALPATLLLFFVRDRLQVPNWQALYLGAYFLAAAGALPLWVRCVKHLGLQRTWLAGMVLSVLAFCVVPFLQPGDPWPFMWVCLASGAALGADLVVPGALLAGVVAKAGVAGKAEGHYFGWWAFATKLNLALAAGLALPLLGLLGYSSGATDSAALNALAVGYGALPCALKIIAALTLVWLTRPNGVLASPVHP
jgi:GPH family glycoside/pentoside/hexuronide:cation symporter